MMVALGVGRPIVASAIGLFKELLEDGKHGYLVPQQNPQALAAALQKLIENTDLRLNMGQNVRQLGNDIPDWAEIGRMTTDVYAKLKS
jgi:glycosyltransferase involved in cell wall biosynthesis